MGRAKGTTTPSGRKKTVVDLAHGTKKAARGPSPTSVVGQKPHREEKTPGTWKRVIAACSRDVSPEITSTPARTAASGKRRKAHHVPRSEDERYDYVEDSASDASGDLGGNHLERVCKRSRSKRKRQEARSEKDEEGEDQREEQCRDQDDDDVYEVEAIVNHKKGKGGALKYQLKWKGYSDESNTWEAAENLSCEELINEYWENIKQNKPCSATAPHSASAGAGGKSHKKVRARELLAKGGGRKSAQGETGDGHAAVRHWRDTVTMNGPAATCADDAAFLESDNVQREFRVPPFHQWEDKAFRIVSVEQSPDGLLGEIEWYPGICTTHPTSVIREHCPRKLVDFYELRLRFITKHD